MEDTKLQPLIGEVLPKDLKNLPDVPQELRSTLVKTIEKDWPQIIEAQADLAKGLWIKQHVKDKDGKYTLEPAKVYQEKPDRDAGQYLINQVIGKPKENMVVAGKVNFILDL